MELPFAVAGADGQGRAAHRTQVRRQCDLKCTAGQCRWSHAHPRGSHHRLAYVVPMLGTPTALRLAATPRVHRELYLSGITTIARRGSGCAVPLGPRAVAAGS
eukprot:scaffold4498_cov119-Isochrysis_galbana.AAC.15